MGLSTGLGLTGPFRRLEEDVEDRLPWLACLAAASTSMLTARRLSGLLKSSGEEEEEEEMGWCGRMAWCFSLCMEESVFRLRSEVPLYCEKVL